MWIPSLVIEYFKVSKEAVDELRIELAAVRAERDAIKLQQAVDRTHFDWLRTRINALEAENKALIQKAYDIRLPVPELMRQTAVPIDPNQFTFEDVGDELARKLGLPVYGDPTALLDR